MKVNEYHGYRSTKFIIAMSTLGIGSIGLFTGHVSDTVWASSVGSVVLFYLGANVGARFTEKWKNGQGGQA